MGVAGPKPSDAGEGAASPKYGSGQEPTRVGPGPDSASAAEGTPGGKGAARPKPSDAGEGAASPPGRSPGRVGSPLGWCPAQSQPALQKARQAARA